MNSYSLDHVFIVPVIYLQESEKLRLSGDCSRRLICHWQDMTTTKILDLLENNLFVAQTIYYLVILHLDISRMSISFPKLSDFT